MFTESECKALQGFPKEFNVPVSRTSMYHQFGNAVAVPVVSAIAEEMVQVLDKLACKPEQGSRQCNEKEFGKVKEEK